MHIKNKKKNCFEISFNINNNKKLKSARYFSELTDYTKVFFYIYILSQKKKKNYVSKSEEILRELRNGLSNTAIIISPNLYI